MMIAQKEAVDGDGVGPALPRVGSIKIEDANQPLPQQNGTGDNLGISSGVLQVLH